MNNYFYGIGNSPTHPFDACLSPAVSTYFISLKLCGNNTIKAVGWLVINILLVRNIDVVTSLRANIVNTHLHNNVGQSCTINNATF